MPDQRDVQKKIEIDLMTLEGLLWRTLAPKAEMVHVMDDISIAEDIERKMNKSA